MNQTKGLDPWKKERVGELFRKLQKEGTTIVMATHDIEFAAKYVDRCMMLFDGAAVMNDAPKEFFSGNFFYTTSINRFIRKELPYALTWRTCTKRVQTICCIHNMYFCSDDRYILFTTLIMDVFATC